MVDVQKLTPAERDALREVANIGAGHAATALSQMTGRKIMIDVPEVSIRPLEEATDLVGPPDGIIAAVLMHMVGDLTGRTLLVLPEKAAKGLCQILLRRPAEPAGLCRQGRTAVPNTGTSMLPPAPGLAQPQRLGRLRDRPRRTGTAHRADKQEHSREEDGIHGLCAKRLRCIHVGRTARSLRRVHRRGGGGLSGRRGGRLDARCRSAARPSGGRSGIQAWRKVRIVLLSRA